MRGRRARLWTGIGSALLLLGASALFAIWQGARRPETLLERRENANVIVVSFDALRADALGIYGSPWPTSPRIDQFASRCVVFDSAYTAGPVTPTSFAAAFTGRLPNQVFKRWQLTSSDVLARFFARAGYRTAAFINNVQLMPDRKFDQGFQLYDHFHSTEDEVILDRSLAWLSSHRSERVFVWIHFLNPHSPYDYREISNHLYDQAYRGGFEQTSGPTPEAKDPLEVARLRSLYLGEVFYADLLFGRLVDALTEYDLLERSFVVLTSDHGEELNEHGRFGHDRLTEGVLRVPLLICAPGVSIGRRVAVPVSNIDLLPTLLDLTGLPQSSGYEGRSFVEASDVSEPIIAVSMTSRHQRSASIRMGRYKLIVTCKPEYREELYDLEVDPDETHPLSPGKGQAASQLRKVLWQKLGTRNCEGLVAQIEGRDVQELAPAAVEALRQLGYVE